MELKEVEDKNQIVMLNYFILDTIKIYMQVWYVATNYRSIPTDKGQSGNSHNNNAQSR
jgi:hypothetical protein